MTLANFRFYADLNEFLPSAKRQKTFPLNTYEGDQSVKHLIEANGVPHTEVGLILANNEAVDFSYLVQPGDRISVFPEFRTLNVQLPIRLRPPISEPARFLLDNHLGKLARYLRLLGFDTWYFHNQLDDAQLAQMAADEKRILLTRDRGLLMRSVVVHGYCLHTKDSKKQTKAVLQRFHLTSQITPWKRCLRCNGILQPIEKAKIIERLEPKTKRFFYEFQICSSCQQIYWKGSHFKKLERFVEEMKS